MAFRDGPFENIKVPLSWTAAVVVFVGVVASIFLMATDRTDASGQRGHASVRAGFESVVGPVNGVLAWPGRWGRSITDSVGGYFGAVSENRRLKARIVELEAWRNEAIALKNVNARYESLLGIRTDPPVPMTSARSTPTSDSARLSSWPDWPTNGRPICTSLVPGPSPIAIHLGFSGPSPCTGRDGRPPFENGHAVQLGWA